MLFRCIHTGQTYKFESEFDIKAMLKHPEYKVVEEVKEESEPEVKTQKKLKEAK